MDAEMTSDAYSDGVYEKCREQERIREKKWRHTKQGRFESSFCPMDALIDSFDDPSKIYAFSDRGEMAYAIRHYEEYCRDFKDFCKRVIWARRKVRRISRELLRTLDLILKHGSNRSAIYDEMENQQNERKNK